MNTYAKFDKAVGEVVRDLRACRARLVRELPEDGASNPAVKAIDAAISAAQAEI